MKNKVRTAVIPVAGYGTRFLPATKAQPKEMLPVLDKPGVQYVVEEAVAAGIEDIVFVTGASKRAIEDHFDSNLELENRLKRTKKTAVLRSIRQITTLANFLYVRQHEPRGTGDAVLTAEPAIENEPFVMLFPDDLLLTRRNPVAEMIKTYERFETLVIGVLPIPRRETNKYGVIKNKQIEPGLHQVLGFVEKPEPAKAPSTLASVKGFVLPPGIFDYLRTLRPSKSGEIWLTDAVEAYRKDHSAIACEFDGDLYDLGSKLGWLKANVTMGLQRADIRVEFRRFLQQQL